MTKLIASTILLWVGYLLMRGWMGCFKLAFRLNPPPKLTVEQELHAAGLFLHSGIHMDKRSMH